MRKLIFAVFAGACLVACNNEQKQEAEKSETAAAPAPISLSMPLTYSSSFEMGNPAYATMIVQGSWRDWQDNNLDNMKSWIADTIVAYHSDNMMVSGADSLMARWKKGRAEYSSVVDSINAVISVHSTDRNEDWVLVWATEKNTKPDGTVEDMALMETWRINKDGKADLLLQYDRATRKK